MKLRVRHLTRYRYGEPVTTSHHEAHVVPRAGAGVTLSGVSVQISPAPTFRRERLDYFGNHTLSFSLHEPHQELEVVGTAVVERSPTLMATPLALAVAGAVPSSPPWEEVRAAARDGRSPEALDAFELTFESPRIETGTEQAAYAAASFPAGRPLLEAVRDLTRRIHQDFRYDTTATAVSTSVAEVMQDRRGVCQDFAHVQIACLRALGLPARYVSGYLLTHPPPGRPKLVGADASHAWLSVWVPGPGWVDFDPTNDLLPADEHVTVAVGRDFADVTPLKGVILGGGAHQVHVAVDVEALP
jgi:transglutaminase-like putative cysteine protease